MHHFFHFTTANVAGHQSPRALNGNGFQAHDPSLSDDGRTDEKENVGGRGGIRTHGGLPHARFRVECLKPDSATLPNRSILSILFCAAQLSDAAPSLQRQSIARSGDSGRLLWNESARQCKLSE